MSPAADNPRLFALNLVVLLLTGVLFSFWMLYYTDWFPVVGGLLGLTGVFAWIAFIAGVLSDKRKESLQLWFDRKVLQSRLPWLLCIAGLALFAVLVFARTGTLFIDTAADELSRAVTVAPVKPGGKDEPLGLHISAGSESQQLLSTGWMSPSRYRVMAAGLPDVFVEISPGRITEVALPEDALSAPVILVRPEQRLSAITANGGFKLIVTRGRDVIGEISDFKGSTAWIGARADVVIPPRRIERWEKETVASELLSQAVERWRWPVALPDPPQLSFGEQLRISIVNSSDPTRPHAVCATVTPPASQANFPQELVIHVGDTC